MPDALSMLAGPVEHAVEIRKSRFLARAARADAVAEAMTFLRDASDHTATHNCWAYRIGHEYRFNDDGEPGGSAGRPILAAIDGQGFDRTIVIVTRWFGGTKLGVGGLVRAYGGTAAECLRLAAREPIVASARVRLECDYPLLQLLKSRLAEHAATIEDERFKAQTACLVLRLPETELTAFERHITDLSRGRALPQRLD